MLFIDIGAMNGREIKWAVEHGYEVHAFEPNIHLKLLLEPFEKIATINYAAAWFKDGNSKLYLMATNEPGEDGVSMIGEKTNVSKDKVMEVKTINIGKYLKNLDKDVDILKINTEGSEYIIIQSILENFDPKRVKKWLVEDHENYIKSSDWLSHKHCILMDLDELGIKLDNWEGKL